MQGDSFGRHRVVSPSGSLPQAATLLDTDMSTPYDDEILIDVDVLNVDSASFRQIEESVGAGEPGEPGEPGERGERGGAGDAGIARVIEEIVRARGKLHNPVTGSGGMLLGRVARIGPALAGVVGLGRGLAVGDRVATLVSLTLTPLALERIVRVRRERHQVEVVGRAVLFASGQLARMPADMAESMALAALDVAGAAPQVARLVRQLAAPHGAPRVLVLGGGGKSGVLSCAAARAAGARVVAVEPWAKAAAELGALGLCEAVIEHDARDALGVRERVLAALGGECDLVVSCVNVPEVEMTAVLAVRNAGTVYFFSMATSFTRAALGAEGVSRDVTMIIGNGYCPGHAEETLDLLRRMPAVRALFDARYA